MVKREGLLHLLSSAPLLIPGPCAQDPRHPFPGIGGSLVGDLILPRSNSSGPTDLGSPGVLTGFVQRPAFRDFGDGVDRTAPMAARIRGFHSRTQQPVLQTRFYALIRTSLQQPKSAPSVEASITGTLLDLSGAANPRGSKQGQPFHPISQPCPGFSGDFKDGTTLRHRGRTEQQTLTLVRKCAFSRGRRDPRVWGEREPVGTHTPPLVHYFSRPCGKSVRGR
jgi:hypothetical protein